MSVLKKRRNQNGNGGMFPSLKNDFLANRFFMPRLFDLDDDFWNSGVNTPPANISETDKEYQLELSVPGVKRDDIKIDVEDGMITVSSEKEEESKDENKGYKRREFSYSSFSRSFQLPDNIDENNINAKYEDGMLCLTIPKKETAVSKPRKQIKIS
ncbi:MAG: molecular chaperone Hsp20 [Bacteroidetes bacterium]|jgi:HSP20 family protein|nr:molecular chaperone Hsp20 [Bacteroidota bacterium]